MAEESALSFDFLRHRAGLDLTPEQQTEFQRLIKLLRYGSAFQTLFVEIARPRLRDDLIGRLDEVLAGAKSERLDLSTAGLADVHALELALHQAQENGAAIIHLVNGDAWLDDVRLEALNLKREALAHGLKCRLVFWLPAPVLDRIARRAADLWSWRSGVVSLLDGTSALPELSLGDFAPRPSETGNLVEKAKRVALLRQWLKQPMDDETRLPLLDELATLLAGLGEWEAALDIRRDQEIPIYQARGDLRSEAFRYIEIADILVARGELDRALDLHRNISLPMSQKLGDSRIGAIIYGKVADILMKQGKFDDALDTLRTSSLPMFQQAGDVRSEAVTHGKIADVFQYRGELDSALEIRLNRELPVFQRIGDAREEAVTQSKIANIMAVRGELDTALEIFNGQVLPIFRKMGDVREEAVVHTNVASILELQGHKGEALSLLRQTAQVFQKLGDSSLAHNLKQHIAELEKAEQA